MASDFYYFILRWEGAFVDAYTRGDRNAANYGVSDRWLCGDTPQENDLSKEEVLKCPIPKLPGLFMERFWEKEKLNRYPEKLANILYGVALNVGMGTTWGFVENLRRKKDGLVPHGKSAGPVKSWLWRNRMDPELPRDLWLELRQHHRNLLMSKSGYRVYMKGWSLRDEDLRKLTGI